MGKKYPEKEKYRQIIYHNYRILYMFNREKDKIIIMIIVHCSRQSPLVIINREDFIENMERFEGIFKKGEAREWYNELRKKEHEREDKLGKKTQ